MIWLAIGITGYVLYRRNQGLSLTQTTKVVMPKPIVEHEVEYQSVLVAFEDGAYSADAVATAAKLAARRRRGIHVLVTITVPANAPIDASMPGAEEKAQSAVDSAQVRGGRRVTGHYEKVRAGEAGRRIVGEAREINAAAIVMPHAAEAHGHLGVRPHPRDGARRAALPGDHRLPTEDLGSRGVTRSRRRCSESCSMLHRHRDGGEHRGARRGRVCAGRDAGSAVRRPGRGAVRLARMLGTGR